MERPMLTPYYPERDLFGTLLGDGRPLLMLTGFCLALAGAFALFLALSGQFLPHDIAFLGMTPTELCSISDCRVVGFMIHDRIAFGGALLAIGLLYLWLTEFPLRDGQGWAWGVLAASGLLGFGSFLSYLGTGYLDTWHGIASLCLLPCFSVGLYRAWQRLPVAERRWTWRSPVRVSWRTRHGAGRFLLLLLSVGMLGAGATILAVGGSIVFVPQDLTFMCLTPTQLAAINERLIPLIAHDRIGFGGAVATTALALLGIVWYSAPSRHLWQILALTLLVGFGSAIGAHPFVGYLSTIHLAPAYAGAILSVVALALSRKWMLSQVDK